MDTTTGLNPHDIATAITNGWAANVAADARPGTPHPYVYASAYRACDRRTVLEMTSPDRQAPWTADTLAKFRRGRDRERDLLIDLTRIGRACEPSFEVVGQQERFELKDHKSRVAIVGKVDAQIAVDRTTVAPLEVKAWSPFLVDRIRRFADLFDSPWTRAGAYQLLAYLYGKGVPFGFMLLDRAGLPLLLAVELNEHLAELEEFLARAEVAIDHREAGTLPDYITDAAECKRCPFYGSECNPPLLHAGVGVISDPELETALARREALDAAATEFDHLDKQIKTRLRGVERAVAGPFLIEGKWGKQATIELPAALKAQYTKVDPKGRFTLTVTRVA